VLLGCARALMNYGEILREGERARMESATEPARDPAPERAPSEPRKAPEELPA
jgi:hypothetical protein